ncbi:MAG: hypothetical protein ACJA1B_000233 [Polaribacter sp.]|jgi:hypothetical protein
MFCCQFAKNPSLRYISNGLRFITRGNFFSISKVSNSKSLWKPRPHFSLNQYFKSKSMEGILTVALPLLVALGIYV